jgi:hypothetical protein
MFGQLIHITDIKNEKQKTIDAGVTITDNCYCLNFLHWTAGDYHFAVLISIFPSQY